MIQSSPVITIDGPSGVGKGTLSQYLAHKLQWHYLDSGAIYRALAYYTLYLNIDLNDEKAIVDCIAVMPLSFKYTGEKFNVFMNDILISDKIRTLEIAERSSKVAKIPIVREGLLEKQRSFQCLPGLVADGRDMGTVVFPKAEIKLFLEASLEARAKRRYKELKEKKNNVKMETVMCQLRDRDVRDVNRKSSPLFPAEDAYVIDTTYLSIPEVIETVMKIIANDQSMRI